MIGDGVLAASVVIRAPVEVQLGQLVRARQRTPVHRRRVVRWPHSTQLHCARITYIHSFFSFNSYVIRDSFKRYICIYTGVAVVSDDHLQRPSVVAVAVEGYPLGLHHLDVLELDVDGGLAGTAASRVIVRPVVGASVAEGFVVVIAVPFSYDFFFFFFVIVLL